MKKMIKPTDLKAKVKAVSISNKYNWEKQSQTDVVKWGTSGNTSQYSPGKIFNDSDSYTD